MKAAPLRVLVVGALTRTGQQVIRSLASRRDDFTVTALCGREMGALIADDTGTLADASMGVRFLGEGGGTATADAVDAVVIATDDPPPEASLQCLLESCSREGVAQTVLLSRIGASKGALGLGRWKDAEECALAQSTAGLTILRCAQPLIGGPYYALDPDSIGRGNAQLADMWRAADVAPGDGALKQGGFGCSRATAASAIAGVLRRGPAAASDSYCVVSVDTTSSGGGRVAWTDAQWDSAFPSYEGTAVASEIDPEIEIDPEVQAATLTLDLSDERLVAFTQPQAVEAPNPLVAPLAAAGPYYFTAALFVYGFYLTTQPSYIETTGVNLWQGILN